MTQEEKIVVSAYTGYLMCDFGLVHKYVEEKMGRPVWTHEMRASNKAFHDVLHEKVKPDFLRLCVDEAETEKHKGGQIKPIGNNAKMRKALIIVYDWILKAGNVHGYPDTEQKRRQLYDMMTKALAAPPRNCDVGTPREQELRMDEWCHNGNRHCRCGDDGCPIYNIKNNCVFDWLQLPYEEGETK